MSSTYPIAEMKGDDGSALSACPDKRFDSPCCRALLAEMLDFTQLGMEKKTGSSFERAKARAPMRADGQGIPSLWTN